MQNIKIIAFDADDTLWHNEAYFQETEKKFYALLEDYMPEHALAKELFHTEMKNLELYGYGIKSFILSMIESAINISSKTISVDDVQKIIQYGKEMMEMPVDIIDGVEEVLSELQKNYRLVLATKGDLLDQQRKLVKSGLEEYFHHIEIMTGKKEEDYKRLLGALDIEAKDFAMIGNSLKSDVLPVLELGGYGFHVPSRVTWAHEHVERKIDHPKFYTLASIKDILDHLLNTAV